MISVTEIEAVNIELKEINVTGGIPKNENLSSSQKKDDSSKEVTDDLKKLTVTEK